MEILPKFVYLTKSKLNIKDRKDMKINIGACKKRKFRGNIDCGKKIKEIDRNLKKNMEILNETLRDVCYLNYLL